MDKLNLALQLILSLSILVVLHEMGHYLPAKFFKTKVEKFYLFFDPYFSLFKKKIGDTEWGIGWIPFGGYVKIAGMIDESMDKDQMKQPPQEWEFRSKKPWQRLIIMVGGVTVNFILGIIIFAGMMMYWGESYIKPADAQYGIAVDSLGMDLGLLDGDQILSVGGVPLTKLSPDQVTKEIVINQAKEIVIIRDSKEQTLPVDPSMVGKLTKYENRGKMLFVPRIPLGINDVTKGGNAEAAGLTKDMKILAVNGQPVPYQHQLPTALRPLKSTTGKFEIIDATGDTIQKDIAITENGTIGIQLAPMNKFVATSSETYSFIPAVGKGWNMATGFLGNQLKAFGQIFTGKIKAKDSLGSVLSIATMFDSGWDWRIFWNITASLSILLAFFNLLPIPALDGGYVMFLLYEMITGKVPSDKFMEVVNYIGFILLMGLMVFALGLDISRWF